MARRRGASATPQDAETPVQLFGHFLQPERANPAGREFDGKGDTVQLAADFGHHRHILILQHERARAGGDTVQEKLDCGEFSGIGQADFGAFIWNSQRFQPVHMFTLNLQRLPAGRKNPYEIGLRDNLLGQHRGPLDQMFAAIQQDKEALLAKEGDEAGQRIAEWGGDAERRRDHPRQQSGIADGGEVDEIRSL